MTAIDQFLDLASPLAKYFSIERTEDIVYISADDSPHTVRVEFKDTGINLSRGETPLRKDTDVFGALTAFSFVYVEEYDPRK